MDVALWVWGALLAGILAMLAVDLFMHRDAHVIGVKEAAVWSLIWVCVAVAVGGAIWWYYGTEFGLQYFAGYIIEKSLAIDNVFVWAMIFSYFAVPRQYQHRVLFYGVLGALVFRAIFIAAGSVLNWAAEQQAQRREVQFHNLHRLVAVLFNVLGVNEHAWVLPRKN